jgi:hypothetical protein
MYNARLVHLVAHEREATFAVLDELRQAFAGVPVEELERETDRITAEIREEGPGP